MDIDTLNAPSPGIAAVSYVFPRERRTLHELAAEGRLQTSPEVLSRFGFDSVHVAMDESPFDLAMGAAGDLLQREGVDPRSVDVLLYGGPQGARGGKWWRATDGCGTFGRRRPGRPVAMPPSPSSRSMA